MKLFATNGTILFEDVYSKTPAELLQTALKSNANLRFANLRFANLRHANLNFADLRYADLRFADLIFADLIIQQLIIVPEGTLIGWKKCRDDVIVKLEIPADAKRSNASGRKCRAEFAKVLEVIGAEVGISQHNASVQYKPGEIVRSDSFDENRWNECSNGIHFFITRAEAEAY